MIVECPKCGLPFENNTNRWTKKFCSRRCANGRPKSEETRQKQSVALRGRTGRGKSSPGWSENTTIQWRAKVQKTYEQKYLSSSFDELSITNKRRRVLEEQHGVCNGCQLSEWRGKPITFELEHKNGNRNDNRRENLEMLCPNCHMLTDTWRGRNNRVQVSDEQLLEALRTCKTPSEALRSLGLADKGGNFKRVRRLLNQP